MKTKASKFLMVFFILVVLASSVTPLFATDKCHQYCAKKYPKYKILYDACYDGCINAKRV